MFQFHKISTAIQYALSAAAIAGAVALGAPAQAEGNATPGNPVVTMTDGVISPERIEVAAGTAFTLELHNAGKTAAEFESHRLHVEKILAPGARAAVKIRALPKGEYPFVDEFHQNQKTAHGVLVAK